MIWSCYFSENKNKNTTINSIGHFESIHLRIASGNHKQKIAECVILQKNHLKFKAIIPSVGMCVWLVVCARSGCVIATWNAYVFTGRLLQPLLINIDASTLTHSLDKHTIQVVCALMKIEREDGIACLTTVVRNNHDAISHLNKEH